MYSCIMYSAVYILDSDLADIDTFVESIELDYGVYCRMHTDARQVYISTTHAGASQLPSAPFSHATYKG